MTFIYLIKKNCECYGVNFQKKKRVKVQKLKDISADKNNLYKLNPMETFLGKSESCKMTALSGAFDKSVFDGNTILLKIIEENGKHTYLYIGGDMICSSLTNDKICKYISNMGKNLTPFSIAIGYQNIYFLTPWFKFVEKEKIHYDDEVELFGHDVSNCETLRVNENHSNFV